LGLETIDREGDRVVFRFARRPPRPARLVTFLERRKDVTLVPPAGMRLDLKAGQAGQAGRAGQAGQAGRSVSRVCPVAAGWRAAAGAWAGRGRGPCLMVDSPGHSGGSDRRVHEGRNPEAQGGRPSGPSGVFTEWGAC
jgi:hypothetical protein